MALLSSFKEFCDLIDPIVKRLLIPLAVVCLYAGTAWLDKDYVSKQCLDGEFQKENKVALEGISTKLDTLITLLATYTYGLRIRVPE
jgi:hypothetical protein